jgi:hypothetical protein
MQMRGIADFGDGIVSVMSAMLLSSSLKLSHLADTVELPKITVGARVPQGRTVLVRVEMHVVSTKIPAIYLRADEGLVKKRSWQDCCSSTIVAIESSEYS